MAKNFIFLVRCSGNEDDLRVPIEDIILCIPDFRIVITMMGDMISHVFLLCEGIRFIDPIGAGYCERRRMDELVA